MHISDTGAHDPAAYGLADMSGQERPNWWSGLAALVPVALLYALVALLSAMATTVSGAGVSWTPPG